ncbi:hypothetical protein BCA37_11810 [Mycobacterium sp. djl-10]|nr:hypothetical protein BCA37_11810 [Mycobacterium sp. djl-10]
MGFYCGRDDSPGRQRLHRRKHSWCGQLAGAAWVFARGLRAKQEIDQALLCAVVDKPRRRMTVHRRRWREAIPGGDDVRDRGTELVTAVAAVG